jgi:hypothetical protein
VILPAALGQETTGGIKGYIRTKPGERSPALKSS